MASPMAPDQGRPRSPTSRCRISIASEWCSASSRAKARGSHGMLLRRGSGVAAGVVVVGQPTTWLFPGRDPLLPMTTRQLYRVVRETAGWGSRSACRAHARTRFATHLLEQGVDIGDFEVACGDSEVEHEARYADVVSRCSRDVTSPLDQLTPSPRGSADVAGGTSGASSPGGRGYLPDHGVAGVANQGRRSHAQDEGDERDRGCRTAALGGSARCGTRRAATLPSPTTAAATVIVRGARAVRPARGWRRARPSCWRCPTSMSCSHCHRGSAPSRIRTRLSSTICCSRRHRGAADDRGRSEAAGSEDRLHRVVHLG